MNFSDFDEYIRQGEPSRKEKAQIWQTAIGLQDVDGLKPSQYLLDNAKANIEGDITIAEVKKRLDTYYKQERKTARPATDRSEEADKVSAHIAEILAEKTFVLSPTELTTIHRRLFTGVEGMSVRIGQYRDYNITKSEWVLDGATVYYASADTIAETLAYDFGEEKKFKYKGLSKREKVNHIVKFISDVWQIHAFGEGNTRTTTVFAIKYLHTFGFKVENDMFAKHSWYFRNALVRAHYNDHTRNIYATDEYLMKFFGNLLFGEQNELKNRHLHIHWHTSEKPKSDTAKPQNDTANGDANGDANGGVNGGVSELQHSVLNIISQNQRISMIKIAAQIGISRRTVENNVKKLKALGILTRIGADKNGRWQINP
jgi:fido (protein-threonine AMPylation protein)/biotin operon repressor